MPARPLTPADFDDLFRPLGRCRHLGAAVSGGADSMTLMHALAEWRQRVGNAPALSVLTVDHGLRPESGEEAEWVAKRAVALGLPHALLRWEGEKPGTGLQAAARARRYDLMAARAHTSGIDCIVTAHHLDDQAETLLMRLARGSGVDGLAGIPAESQWAGIAIRRPFLDVPGARLAATLRAAGRDWLDDPSNEDPAFERVRLRKARPALAALGITDAALARSARRLTRARAALDAGAAIFLKAHAELAETGHCRIDRNAFRAAPEEIAIRALGQVLEAVGGGAEMRLARLESLVAALRSDKGRARTLAGCRVAPADDGILVTREPGRAGLPELTLDPGATALWDRRYAVALPPSARRPVSVRALGPQGYRAVREKLGNHAKLPPGAARTLVSFWRGERLCAVPQLGYRDPETRAACSAEFVHASWPGETVKAKTVKLSP